jgi:hypothetical protein
MKKKILLGEQAQYNFIFGEYIFNIWSTISESSKYYSSGRTRRNGGPSS